MKSDKETKDISSLGEIKFDAHGLVPAIIVESVTSQVLMLAYMNRVSLLKTLETGNTWFYSRSRKKLWMKGETSGNTQKVASIKYDCDIDALLISVEQNGPACHTDEKSCFYREMDQKAVMAAESGGSVETGSSVEGATPVEDAQSNGHNDPARASEIHTTEKLPRSGFDLDVLLGILQSRKKEMPEGSYTTSLFKEGPAAICAKIEEESDEVIDAVFNKTRDDLIWEIGDLFYHTLALMAFEGVEMSEVLQELERRHKKKSSAT